MSSCGFRFLRTDKLEAHQEGHQLQEEFWVDSGHVPRYSEAEAILTIFAPPPLPKARLLRPIDVILPQLKLLSGCNWTYLWKLPLSGHMGTAVFRSLTSRTYKIGHNMMIQLPDVPHLCVRCSSGLRILILCYVPLNLPVCCIASFFY